MPQAFSASPSSSEATSVPSAFCPSYAWIEGDTDTWEGDAEIFSADDVRAQTGNKASLNARTYNEGGKNWNACCKFRATPCPTPLPSPVPTTVPATVPPRGGAWR